MKYIITEQQYKLLTEEKVYEVDYSVFNKDWDILQRHLKKKGNPPYKVTGNLVLDFLESESLNNLISVDGELSLYKSNIKSLGNLKSVEGTLMLFGSPLESLGELKYVGGNLDLRHTYIESLGNLTYVGQYLDLDSCENLRDLGNLEYVGDDLILTSTPLSKMTTEDEIWWTPNLNVRGRIFL